MPAALTYDVPQARRRLMHQIDRATMRLRLQEALRSGVFSVTIVAWLLAPLIFVDRLLNLGALGINVYIVWLALLALCIPYVLVRCFSQRIHEELAAALADERLGLHARLCTALTLSPNEASGFGEAFFSEAAEKLAALDSALAFPIRAPRIGYLLPLPLMLAAGLWKFMPQKDLLGIETRKQEQERRERAKQETVEELKKQLGKLEDLKSDEKKPVSENSAEYKVKQLIQQAKDLAKKVEEGDKTAEEGIVAMADLKRAIEEQKQELKEGKDFTDRLKQLGEKDLNLEEGAMTREISEALKDGDAALAAEQMRRLGRKLKNEILDNDKLNAEQKAEALKQLQREMEKLAGALAEEEALREGLQQVSENSMSAAEYQELQKEIQKREQKDQGENGQNRDKDQKAQEQAEKLQEAMDDVAKRLEEQEDRNEEKLSEDEQEALEKLDELEEGLDDAMEGLCESCEGGAKGQRGKGAQRAAAKGGAKGAKESGAKGQKRDADSGDAEGQEGDQDRLSGEQRGGDSGENGGKEDDQQGSGDGSQNGNPGNQANPNPAFSGPNQGGPGAGRRAYRDGDAWFEESKIKGKLQAGAITGLSYFRGQGAKGEVPAEYVQALTSAEQEASSSLELDRVPADAREMVKDYFQNLKQDAGLSQRSAPQPAPPPANAGDELKE